MDRGLIYWPKQSQETQMSKQDKEEERRHKISWKHCLGCNKYNQD